MPGGFGFQPYPQRPAPAPAAVGAALMQQGQKGQMGQPGQMDPMGAEPDLDDAPMAPEGSPLPSQSSGNPVSSASLLPQSQEDPLREFSSSSSAAMVGQLLSRTAGGMGKNRSPLPPLANQDDLLIRAGFAPEEIDLFRQMGGVK